MLKSVDKFHNEWKSHNLYPSYRINWNAKKIDTSQPAIDQIPISSWFCKAENKNILIPVYVSSITVSIGMSEN